MSPLFLVGCGLIVAAVLLGATGAPAAVWVLLGALGLALFWRGATTTPKRRIRSHSDAARRARSAASRAGQAKPRAAQADAAPAARARRRPGTGRRPR